MITYQQCKNCSTPSEFLYQCDKCNKDLICGICILLSCEEHRDLNKGALDILKKVKVAAQKEVKKHLEEGREVFGRRNGIPITIKCCPNQDEKYICNKFTCECYDCDYCEKSTHISNFKMCKSCQGNYCEDCLILPCEIHDQE